MPKTTAIAQPESAAQSAGAPEFEQLPDATVGFVEEDAGEPGRANRWGSGLC